MQSPTASSLKITKCAVQLFIQGKEISVERKPQDCSPNRFWFISGSSLKVLPFSELSMDFAPTKINCCSPISLSIYNKVVPYLSLTTTLSLTMKSLQSLHLTMAHLLLHWILFRTFTPPLSLTYPLYLYSVFNLTAKCIFGFFLPLQIFIQYHCSLPYNLSYFADPDTLSTTEFKLTQPHWKQTQMTWPISGILEKLTYAT